MKPMEKQIDICAIGIVSREKPQRTMFQNKSIQNGAQGTLGELKT